ncbi:MAG TPA: nuclear transport factor 2 family protein [Vicinamibacterales bacterium]|nr:nuclear transport factor 2 family protein [Vicinamibacterales bacterium]
MPRIRAVLSIGVLVLAAACGRREPPFGRADADRIRERAQEYEAAFNAKDVARLLTFHSPEAVFMPPNEPIRRGREAIEAYYRDLLAQGATELAIESKDIGGHGPLAYESGTYSLNRRPANGPHTRDRGKYIFIWRRTNGGWHIVYTIWSSDLPQRITISP